MYQQEAIKPYNEGDKQQQVEQMFDNIAPTYDKLNHSLSWNIDRHWRRKAIRKMAPYKPREVLDVATGTGDFALMMAKALDEGIHVTATDISEGMMNIGRQKMLRENLQHRMHFERQDCTALTYEDNSFDAVISAFGIRNFNDLDRGLSEMCRVMRTGGHLCILELTQPVSFPMRQLFHIYAHTVLPCYGRIVSKDPAAYTYLTKTIEAFPQGEQMVGILKKAGFEEAGFERLTFGICTMYFATKQ
jgi:demethylmenaquinone methyltransferase/2-methoxy-6-polyprenyl-1,4-benzoquinol methylase